MWGVCFVLILVDVGRCHVHLLWKPLLPLQIHEEETTERQRRGHAERSNNRNGPRVPCECVPCEPGSNSEFLSCSLFSCSVWRTWPNGDKARTGGGCEGNPSRLFCSLIIDNPTWSAGLQPNATKTFEKQDTGKSHLVLPHLTNSPTSTATFRRPVCPRCG